MARILLSDADPAIEALLEGFGHEAVVLDDRADIETQIRMADVVLPSMDSQLGRSVARLVRRMYSAPPDCH